LYLKFFIVKFFIVKYLHLTDPSPLKGVQTVANHKSALKRTRQNDDRRARNKTTRTKVKNAVKQVRLAIAENAADTAAASLKTASSVIDKASKKGVIHKNTAARKIARLAKSVNAVKP
jgi:small subunit ribosomal protein S20